MKHLAVIHTEFLKEATKWNDMSLAAQKQYLREHPSSKRRITAKPEKVQQSAKSDTIESIDATITELQQKRKELEEQQRQHEIDTAAKPVKSKVFDLLDNAININWNDDKVDRVEKVLKKHFPKKTKLIDKLIQVAGDQSNDRSDFESGDIPERQYERLSTRRFEKIEKLLKRIYA